MFGILVPGLFLFSHYLIMKSLDWKLRIDPQSRAINNQEGMLLKGLKEGRDKSQNWKYKLNIGEKVLNGRAKRIYIIFPTKC